MTSLFWKGREWKERDHHLLPALLYGNKWLRAFSAPKPPLPAAVPKPAPGVPSSQPLMSGWFSQLVSPVRFVPLPATFWE